MVKGEPGPFLEAGRLIGRRSQFTKFLKNHGFHLQDENKNFLYVLMPTEPRPLSPISLAECWKSGP